MFFNINLNSNGENIVFKKLSVRKIIDFKETYNVTDIWRIRNPKTTKYTFPQKQRSGMLWRHLDYFLISNNIQGYIKYAKILPALSSHYSPILSLFCNEKQTHKGSWFWKFSTSLLYDKFFEENHIQNIKSNFNDEFPIDDQFKWHLLKNEICKFTVKLFKSCSRK